MGKWINLLTLCWQYTRSVLKALWLTEWDCTVLRHISWQYGKLWQAYIGPYVHKITLNLLAYLANWPGEWLPRCCKTPRWLFPRLCLSLPCAYCLKKKKLPEQAPTKTQLQVHAWAHQWSAYAQLSRLYLLFTLYVRWWIIPGPLPLFHMESWAGPGNKASANPCAVLDFMMCYINNFADPKSGTGIQAECTSIRTVESSQLGMRQLCPVQSIVQVLWWPWELHPKW